MEYKDFFPAENAEEMRKLVANVVETGNQLKPVLNDCLVNHPSERVKAAFKKLSSLITICTNASVTFESRLKVVLKHEAPARVEAADRLHGQNFVIPPRQMLQAAEFQSDKHLKETGRSTHETADAARKEAAAHTKKNEQLEIGKAVFKLAASLAAHIPVVLLETGIAAKGLFTSSKGGQFKHGLEKLAVELEAIEQLEKHLEDMCLFLYLVPELTDLIKGTGVNKGLARERLTAVIG